jgi:hypothetical protein
MVVYYGLRSLSQATSFDLLFSAHEAPDFNNSSFAETCHARELMLEMQQSDAVVDIDPLDALT